uniref:Uncharacterized protein n=1 Tax=Leersia perrieri TaxID=77586 RepID=A0A0D9XL70_9ORYZ
MDQNNFHLQASTAELLVLLASDGKYDQCMKFLPEKYRLGKSMEYFVHYHRRHQTPAPEKLEACGQQAIPNSFVFSD